MGVVDTGESSSGTSSSTGGDDGEVVVRGGLRSLSGGPLGGGTYQIVADGFEVSQAMCGSGFCVRGGIRP